MAFNNCKNCGKHSEIHGGGFCITCYKKLMWKPKKGICERCGRSMLIHSKGLCKGCYNFVFYSDATKARNYKKKHNIDLESYKKITQSCVICGFDKIVDLHHLDENHENNSKTNLVGLCPNHHKMFHDFRYRKEIIAGLEKKGYKVPYNQKMD